MPRKTLVSWLLLVVALSLGTFIAYVDSRPTWDDTGVTAGVILIVSGLLGLAQPRGAWLWALAVGLWVPLLPWLAGRGNPAALIALVVAFIGAFGGALVHQTFTALARSGSTPPT